MAYSVSTIMQITDIDKIIVDEYLTGCITIPSLCAKYALSRKTIKSIFTLYNIPIYKKRPHSRNYPKEYSKQCICNFRKDSLGLSLRDLDKYEDSLKLSFIIHDMRRLNCVEYNTNKGHFLNFIDRFYFDPYFNFLYKRWINVNKLSNYKPSIDHKIPLSKNGTNSLDNLMFLTWFENRAKEDMTWDEWQSFRIANNCKSELYYEQ